MNAVAFCTLGCKTNQLESSALAQQFRELGWRVVPLDTAAADLVVFNTCTVTERADAESRRLIRQAHQRNPRARIAVTGCYAQVSPQAVAGIEGVDFVIGNHLKESLAGLLVDELPTLSPRSQTAEATPGEWPKVWVNEWDKSRVKDALQDAIGGSAGVTDEGGSRVRASLKIQDGCDYKCTYCVIWQGRGPSRSVAPETLETKVQRLVAEGFKEIVLTGINIGQYQAEGVDLNGLLQRLAKLPGEFRLRLTSLDPLELTPELIETVAAHPQNIAPHFHLSAQSCQDDVLKGMARRHHVADYIQGVQAIKAALPHACIASDMIVGFPGETDARFEATFQVLRDHPMDVIHVFRFSPRPGTPAADARPQVPDRVRKVRAQRLQVLSSQKHEAFASQQLGHPQRVLLEKAVDVLPQHVLDAHPSGLWMEGLSDNYTRVWVLIPDAMLDEHDYADAWVNTWAEVTPQLALLPSQEDSSREPILLGALLVV
jgi:threonylcarbamoyladenosine tRNA methylthiotransferase MtaB